MKDITLAKAWSYVTPEKTIDYPAGTHTVTDEIHKAAVKAEVVKEEKTDGGRVASAGTGSADGAAKV